MSTTERNESTIVALPAVVIHDFVVRATADKALLLRVLKNERENMVTRMIAVELLESRDFNATQHGEHKMLNVEISFISRLIISLRANMDGGL